MLFWRKFSALLLILLLLIPAPLAYAQDGGDGVSGSGNDGGGSQSSDLTSSDNGGGNSDTGSTDTQQDQGGSTSVEYSGDGGLSAQDQAEMSAAQGNELTEGGTSDGTVDAVSVANQIEAQASIPDLQSAVEVAEQNHAANPTEETAAALNEARNALDQAVTASEGFFASLANNVLSEGLGDLDFKSAEAVAANNTLDTKRDELRDNINSYLANNPTATVTEAMNAVGIPAELSGRADYIGAALGATDAAKASSDPVAFGLSVAQSYAENNPNASISDRAGMAAIAAQTAGGSLEQQAQAAAQAAERAQAGSGLEAYTATYNSPAAGSVSTEARTAAVNNYTQTHSSQYSQAQIETARAAAATGVPSTVASGSGAAAQTAGNPAAAPTTESPRQTEINNFVTANVVVNGNGVTQQSLINTISQGMQLGYNSREMGIALSTVPNATPDNVRNAVNAAMQLPENANISFQASYANANAGNYATQITNARTVQNGGQLPGTNDKVETVSPVGGNPQAVTAGGTSPVGVDSPNQQSANTTQFAGNDIGVSLGSTSVSRTNDGRDGTWITEGTNISNGGNIVSNNQTIATFAIDVYNPGNGVGNYTVKVDYINPAISDVIVEGINQNLQPVFDLQRQDLKDPVTVNNAINTLTGK